MTTGKPERDTRRFAALDGLRGLCALMVVVLHLPMSGWLQDLPLFRHAFLFVDFFFVLSGFVIAHSYRGRLTEGADVARFAFARWRRVYPLHLAMLMLFLAFEFATLASKGTGFEGGNSVSAFWANLFLVHAFGTVSSLGWNYPSWSISAEFGAYLLFALGALCLKRRLPSALGATVVLAVCVLAVLVGHLDTTVSFGWLRCLAGFASGALLRIVAFDPAASKRAGAPPFARATLIEAGTVLLVVLFVVRAGATPLSLAAPFVFTLAVAVFAREEGAASRLLKTPECAFLGLVSYSIYMTHAFVIARAINVGTLVENRTGLDLVNPLADGSKAFSAIASPLALTATLVGTVLFSALTRRFIEVPGQRLRFFAGPKPSPRSAAPSLGRSGA